MHRNDNHHPLCFSLGPAIHPVYVQYIPKYLESSSPAIGLVVAESYRHRASPSSTRLCPTHLTNSLATFWDMHAACLFHRMMHLYFVICRPAESHALHISTVPPMFPHTHHDFTSMPTSLDECRGQWLVHNALLMPRFSKFRRVSCQRAPRVASSSSHSQTHHDLPFHPAHSTRLSLYCGTREPGPSKNKKRVKSPCEH